MYKSASSLRYKVSGTTGNQRKNSPEGFLRRIKTFFSLVVYILNKYLQNNDGKKKILTRLVDSSAKAAPVFPIDILPRKWRRAQ